jgi:hypothetical protein
MAARVIADGSVSILLGATSMITRTSDHRVCRRRGGRCSRGCRGRGGALNSRRHGLGRGRRGRLRRRRSWRRARRGLARRRRPGEGGAGVSGCGTCTCTSIAGVDGSIDAESVASAVGETCTGEALPRTGALVGKRDRSYFRI